MTSWAGLHSPGRKASAGEAACERLEEREVQKVMDFARRGRKGRKRGKRR